MEKFLKFSSIVTPLEKDNIDTDAIIPKQFLKSISRLGFGKFLFDQWRYLDVGELGMDCSLRPKNELFVLNQKKYLGSKILLTTKNFGCGSSREHAVWALSDFGFKVIIAESFADIFYNNCFKNGLLPITLSSNEIKKLFELTNSSLLSITIDLENQKIEIDEKNFVKFEIETYRKNLLLEGLDEIGQTLKAKDEISKFENIYKQKFPWLFSN